MKNLAIVILIVLLVISIMFNGNLDTNIFLTVILVATTIIYTIITAYILKSQTGPKLYAVAKLKENNGTWDKGIMFDFSPERNFENIEGLALVANNKDVTLEIHNNGNRPATDINIGYSVVTYKNDITFGIDKADIVDYKLVQYERVDKELHIDYIPPGGLVSELVFYVSKYPQCEIIIYKLRSKEEQFIFLDTIIFKYNDERFDYIGDSQDLRKLLGVN